MSFTRAVTGTYLKPGLCTRHCILPMYWGRWVMTREAVPSETSVRISQTTRRHIRKEIKIRSHGRRKPSCHRRTQITASQFVASRFTLIQCRLDSASPDFSSFRCVRKDALYVANVVHVLGACVHVPPPLPSFRRYSILFAVFFAYSCNLNWRDTFHFFTL